MKKALQMCMNWKVLAGLAGVALVLWLVAPNAALGILPLLAFLACPLSMVFMMRAMHGGRADSYERRPGASQPIDSGGHGLAELKGRQADLRIEQESIATEIARLESETEHGIREDG